MLDPLRAELIRIIAREARALGLDVVLVGAFARDVLLELMHGIETGRATRDVDIAVAVPSSESFTELESALIGTGRFHRLDYDRARLVFEDSVLVDILPYRDNVSVASPIGAPPPGEDPLDKAAFREACETAVPLALAADLEFKVVTLPGLAALKVIAWSRRHQDIRDAPDLDLLMRRYLDAGNRDRFFADHLDLVDADDFEDLDQAGARMLGRDIRRELGAEVAEQVAAVLERELDRSGEERLVERIARSHGGEDEHWETARGLLSALRAGLLDR